jgi:uncharacterized BrkB/YihY/UPF0761 family membrane protein
LAARYRQEATRHPLLTLPLSFFVRYVSRQGVLLASALAFRMFLWLLPLVLLVTGILMGVSGGDEETLTSMSHTAGITGPAAREIATALQEGHRSWWAAVLVGAAALLWTTRTLIRALFMVSAHVWDVPRPKPTRRELLNTAWVFAICWLGIVGTAALIIRVDRAIPAGLVVSTALQGLTVAAAWLVVSLRLPDRRTSWTDLVPGCLILGVGMALLHAVSRIYLPRKLAHSSQLYGALGVAGVILFWLLLIGQLIVTVMLVNSLWSDYRRSRHTESPQREGHG